MRGIRRSTKPALPTQRRPSTRHPPPIAQQWDMQHPARAGECMTEGQETQHQSLGWPLQPHRNRLCPRHRWTTSCPSCAHNPGCLPKAPLPIRLFPSGTHQARIPLGLTDLCAELLQFQLVHLQVGSGGNHIIGVRLGCCVQDSCSPQPTPTQHMWQHITTPCSRTQVWEPIYASTWDVVGCGDPKATCPRDLAYPCLVRAESCQPQAMSQAVPMPLRSSLPPPTQHLRQALLESFVHLVQAVGLRHLGWWGLVGH